MVRTATTAAEANLGYEFSSVTYGRDNVEIVEETLNYDNLIRQAGDNVITFMVNHAPKQYSLEYVDENKNTMIVKDLEGKKASSQQVKFGDDIKGVAPNDEKLGYDFKCWHILDKNENELTDGNGSPINFETAKANWETLANAADSDNKIKLKAIYSPKKYTIKYNTRSNESVQDREFYIGQSEDTQLDKIVPNSYLMNVYSTGRIKNKTIRNINWRYYVDGQSYYVKSGSPLKPTATWDQLIKSVVVDEDGNNLIILEAVYQ